MSRRVFEILGTATVLVLGLLPVSPARAGNPNFVSMCSYSHSLKDDPIVFPNQPGASHLHDFFANKGTNASSTANSLRGGTTTCKHPRETASYWAPALYDSGQLRTPTYATVYYTAGTKDYRSIKPFSAGLKVVAKERNIIATWSCDAKGAPGKPQASVPTCADGTHLVLHHRFPDCWDGRRLDSADHTSHMALTRYRTCPSTHPEPMPVALVNVHYPSDGGQIVLGSPDMPVAPHADLFNAWDQPTLERLVRVCINAGRQCGTSPP